MVNFEHKNMLRCKWTESHRMLSVLPSKWSVARLYWSFIRNKLHHIVFMQLRLPFVQLVGSPYLSSQNIRIIWICYKIVVLARRHAESKPSSPCALMMPQYDSMSGFVFTSPLTCASESHIPISWRLKERAKWRNAAEKQHTQTLTWGTQ